MSYISTYIPPHFNKTISNNRRQKVSVWMYNHNFTCMKKYMKYEILWYMYTYYICIQNNERKKYIRILTFIVSEIGPPSPQKIRKLWEHRSCTFQLKKVHGLNGVEGGATVQGQVKLCGDARRQLHVFVEILVRRRHTTDQPAWHLENFV